MGIAHILDRTWGTHSWLDIKGGDLNGDTEHWNTGFDATVVGVRRQGDRQRHGQRERDTYTSS